MKLEEKMQNAEEVCQESCGNLNKHSTLTYLLLSPALYTYSRYVRYDFFSLFQERVREEALNQRLRRQVSDYEAPGIAEYMQVKEKHKKLLQSVHTWEKKVEVAQVTCFLILFSLYKQS